jgi:ADP-ribose pyrophosphatase
VVAIVERDSGPEILLQKQFRPPVGKVCIEIPAGLLDPNEDAQKCAVRELKEETGYVGVAKELHPEEKSGDGVMFNGMFFYNFNVFTLLDEVFAADSIRPVGCYQHLI